MSKGHGSERARIELLRARLEGDPAGSVLLGIGDDAAVLAPGSSSLVWTVDAAVENVHFRRDLLTFAEIGYRATMAAASDLAAMGATPLGLLSALVLPVDVDDDDLAALADGQREAARALGTAVVGGNLTRGAELSITTTALGSAPEPMRRGGARRGDALWLAGPLGLAAAGLALLERQDRDPAMLPALDAFRRPRARIPEGLAAAPLANAAIDVSDGLARDLGHIARASGVRAILDPRTLVSSELVAAATRLGRDALELALYGGEDYALVVAAPAAAAPRGFIRIGGCEALGEAQSEVALVAPDGNLTPVEDRGFDHFSGES